MIIFHMQCVLENFIQIAALLRRNLVILFLLPSFCYVRKHSCIELKDRLVIAKQMSVIINPPPWALPNSPTNYQKSNTHRLCDHDTTRKPYNRQSIVIPHGVPNHVSDPVVAYKQYIYYFPMNKL